MMNVRLLFVHALSPLHAGTGQGVGVIDLPIAREKATNLPYLPGSSLKGVLRDACEDETTRFQVFGPDTNNASEYAGSVHFTDQRLLLLPVRSLAGTFAWVTSPFVLHRFLRDVHMAQKAAFPVTVPTVNDGACLVTDNSQLITRQNNVILEDIPLNAAATAAGAWAASLGKALFPEEGNPWRQIFAERLCIVDDEVFGFLVETATEVVARIALAKDTKTVKHGALWHEESLPAETILSGLVVASPVKAGVTTVFKTVKRLIENPLQLGGDATIGRGLCQLRMSQENTK